MVIAFLFEMRQNRRISFSVPFQIFSNHVTSFQIAKGPKIQLFEFGALSSFEKI